MALAALTAGPVAAQDARGTVAEAVDCGGSALALWLLRRQEVRDGSEAARPAADEAKRIHLAIGLHAARRLGCGMGQITYEVGTALEANARLDAFAEATPDGIGFTAETRRVEQEVAACLAERGGEAILALDQTRDARGLIEPCGWRE